MTVFNGNLLPRQAQVLTLDTANPSGFIEDTDLKRGVSFEINVALKDVNGDPTTGTGEVFGAAIASGAGKVDNFLDSYDIATSDGGGWTPYYGTAERFNFNLTGLTPSDGSVEITVNYWVGA